MIFYDLDILRIWILPYYIYMITYVITCNYMQLYVIVVISEVPTCQMIGQREIFCREMEGNHQAVQESEFYVYCQRWKSCKY